MNLFQYITFLLVLNFLTLVGFVIWVRSKIKLFEMLITSTGFTSYQTFKLLGELLEIDLDDDEEVEGSSN